MNAMFGSRWTLRGVGVIVTIAGLACSDRSSRPSERVSQQGQSGFAPASWKPPVDSEIPGDSLGASIRRGLALVTHTPDSLPAFAPGNISCANCHLNAGRN